MNDLRDAFRSLDDLHVPDVHARARAMGPREPSGPSPSGARRLGVIIVATLVAAAGIGSVVVRFQHDTAPGPVTSIPKSNGLIYFRVAGGDGPSWWKSVSQDGTSAAVVFPADSPINHDDVSWSADGTRIAFANTISSREPGIYVSDPDGSHALRLTDQAADRYPSWSPDGSQIAFVRPDPGTDCAPGDALSSALLCATSIYLMDTDGSNIRQLPSAGRHDSQPVWSPDGSQITFTGTLGAGDTRTAIFVMNADGSGARQVSSAAGGSDFSPSWSPGGTQIAFASIRNEDWGISVVGADGSGEHLLVGRQGTYVEGPVWSPDSTTIAFVGDPGLAGASGVDPALLAIPSGGGPARVIAQAPGYGVADIAWQPLLGETTTTAPASESLMAFSVQMKGSTTGLVIAVMHPDGSGFRQLTGLPADRDTDPQIARYTYASDDSPSISPDGQTVAFVRRYGEGLNSLCMIDVDGSNFRVVERDAHMGETAWSPDGRTIAFYSEQDGGIHLIDVDGTNERALWPRTAGPNQDAPSWSPDSSRIYYVSGGVWMADADGSRAHEIIGILSAAGWVAASPDGTLLAVTESSTNSIWVFDNDGTNGRRFTPAVDRRWTALTWSPDGSELVLVADDGTALLTTSDGSRVEQVQLPDRVAVSGAIAWSGA